MPWLGWHLNHKLCYNRTHRLGGDYKNVYVARLGLCWHPTWFVSVEGWVSLCKLWWNSIFKWAAMTSWSSPWSHHITDFKRKPPCIGGMELVSLSCNRVLISAESVGRGWCEIAIATKWYQFHTTDKCGFLFIPWITDQYTFGRYTKLVNKIGTAVAKFITFSIMTT